MNGQLVGRGQETWVLLLALSQTQTECNSSGSQFSPLETRQAGLTKDTRSLSASPGRWENE